MRFLFVVNTVFELYYLSAVAYLLREARPDITIRLLVRPRTVPALNAELAGLYSDIQELEITYISGRPDWDLINSVRFGRRLSALDLSADIVCISSFREYFANILARHLPRDTRMVAFRMCDHIQAGQGYKRRPLWTMYRNIFNRAFGRSAMDYRWIRQEDLFGLKWYARDFYHRTICISDWGTETNGDHIRLPPPFGSLRDLYGTENGKGLHDNRPAILVAGERTPLFTSSWDAASQSKYEAFFSFLRENFSDHRLLFKPRRGFTDTTKLPLDGFEMVSPDIPFEELCLRNKFRKVVSVRSTASKVAAYCGLPAYLLYTMLDLPAQLAESTGEYFDDMRAIVRVRELDDLLRESDCQHQQIADLPSLYWDTVTG